MSNTYSRLLFHVVFSVKERRNLISSELRKRLYPYICGVAKQNNFTVISIGGTDNHIHILLSLKPDMAVAKAVQLIKGGSSKWLHENFADLKIFSWQEGYGVFTVSSSMAETIKKYIMNHRQHHKKMNFQNEYLEFLKRNNINFELKYLFSY